MTGDGDALSIGGNHLIHALRRNVNLKILLFNNQIYGLTKGQYSPTRPLGTRNEVDADGLARLAVQPALDRARRGGDVRRALDRHRHEAPDRGAARAPPTHKGSALRRDLPELQRLQRRRLRRGREDKENQIRLEHGEPIRFGAEGERGVKLRPDGSCELVDVADVGEDALLVHDEHHEAASLAFSLSRLAHTPHGPTPIGVFRDIERPVYDELMAEQLETGDDRARRGRPGVAPPRRRHLDDLTFYWAGLFAWSSEVSCATPWTSSSRLWCS